MMELLGALIVSLHGDQFEAAMSQWITSFIRADNLTILAYPNNRQPHALYRHAASVQVHEKLESDYLPGAYLLDPFYTLHLDCAPPGLYTLSDVAPDQFQRSKYYSTYFKQTTIVDEMVFATSPTSSTSIHISIGRDAKSGRGFSKQAIEIARSRSPIICALCEQHWKNYRSTDLGDKESLQQALRNLMVDREGVSLSPRQAEVALLILKGHSSLSISLRLGISKQTVKVFRKQLYRKCTISSQAELFSMMMPLLSSIANVGPDD